MQGGTFKPACASKAGCLDAAVRRLLLTYDGVGGRPGRMSPNYQTEAFSRVCQSAKQASSGGTLFVTVPMASRFSI